MPKTKKRKQPTPDEAFKKGFAAYLEQVGLWCKSRTGRSGELAIALNIKNYNVHDWFVSRRFAPPAWVLFAVQKTLVLPVTKPK